MAINEALSTEEQTQMKEMQQADQAAEIAENQVETTPEQVVVETPAVVEQAPVIKEQEQTQEKEKRLVPLSELQEERKARRDAQERLDAILSKLTEVPQAPAKEAPNPDQDPIGALKATADEVKELRKFRESQERISQNNQAVQQVMQRAVLQESEFVKITPDYNEAGQFLRNQRTQQLIAIGYSPQQAHQTIIQESLQLANAMLGQGKSVPQAIYDLAKSSGYSKQAAKTVVTGEGEEARLAKIAAGQKANVSLSNANGVQQKTGQLDAKAIINMDDDKFAEFLGKLSKSDRQAVLGQ